jgi:diaminohydroxyphosphoribosylaminopyrimidine deaminase/5-amino-6-(5-phosphoribosylamino)uracil reductase
MIDPNPLVGGGGVAFLRDHGIEVTVGTGGAEAERLNRPFLTVKRKRRPWIVLKAALSLDGYVAGSGGARARLTGAAADRLTHRDRAEIDALAIGSGTLLADDPLLTARGAYRFRPLHRIIFDRALRTPPRARVLSTLDAGPVIIMGTAAAAAEAPGRAASLRDAGARLELLETAANDAAWMRAAVRRLADMQITSLVVEGGPSVQRAMWEAGVVDEVRLFVTGVVLGRGGLPWVPAEVLPLAELAPRARPVGEDVLVEAYVHRID